MQRALNLGKSLPTHTSLSQPHPNPLPILQMDRRVDITNTDKPVTVKFSYSVVWDEEQLEWKDRMSIYADSRFVPSTFEIHWLSIINSFVLVLLLTAFLTIILLRVLKNDFSRYMELDDDALEEEEVRGKEKGKTKYCVCWDVQRDCTNPLLAHLL